MRISILHRVQAKEEVLNMVIRLYEFMLKVVETLLASDGRHVYSLLRIIFCYLKKFLEI